MTLNGKHGVCYVAYGPPAMREAADSYQALRKHSDAPVAIVGDEKPLLYGVNFVQFEDRSFGARWAKLNLDTLSPFQHTLYLDADTRVMNDAIEAGFHILTDGWDMVIVPSGRQHEDVLGHIDQEEREYTLRTLEYIEPLQLQAGVMFFAKTRRMLDLFEAWREEWQRFKRHDQAALLRAMDRVQPKVWLLSYDWNSRRGSLVEHWFGRARA